MTKFIIAYDDNDPDFGLGSYFSRCKELLIDFLREKEGIDIIEIPANRCTQLFVNIKIMELEGASFCFVAYSHGNENAVVCTGEAYVKVNENTELFKDSLFYTNSCASGKNLGADLIRKDCKAFIGNREESKVLLLNQNLSAKLDNYALLVFIEQVKTIYEAFCSMQDAYDAEYDKLDSWKDSFHAAAIAYSRGALVFHGDKNVKFNY